MFTIKCYLMLIYAYLCEFYEYIKKYLNFITFMFSSFKKKKFY